MNGLCNNCHPTQFNGNFECFQYIITPFFPLLILRMIFTPSCVGMQFLVFSAFLSVCNCVIFQIDSSYPFISVGGISIHWHSGAGTQWGLSSLLVRIHPRGVVFKKQGWHKRELTSIGWKAESCIPSAHGLCQTDSGSVFFPSTQPPEVNEAMTGMCSSTDTKRVITNESRYDVSACDVLDRRVDYVYSGEVINYTDTSLSPLTYWMVCILVVFLVRCLSRYTLASLSANDSNMRKEESKVVDRGIPDPLVSLAVSSACALLIIYQGDFMYVTQEELIFFWFTAFYVSAYTCLFVGVKVFNKVSKATIHDPPFYNLLAGVLQLVATRLYAGAETPYNPPLIFIIAVRAMAKSRREPNLLRGISLLLDSFMLALMCVIGFGPDPHYLVALFTGAWAWADLLHSTDT